MRLRLLIAACLIAGPALAQSEPKILTIPDDEPSIEVHDTAESAVVNVPEDAKPAEEAVLTYNAVILQGLNKVTGHISKLEGPIGTVLNFGSLEIIVQRCWKSAPEERPENAALIEIRELKAGEERKRIFLGWMFSSSPGLSGLEHAVYDINILSCESQADPEKLGKPEKAEKPEKKTPPAAKKSKK